MSNSDIALSCARGSEQRWFVESALNRPTRNYAQLLRGKAKQYSGRYAESFRNLCERLREKGVNLTRTPGPRGGEYSATYVIAAE